MVEDGPFQARDGGGGGDVVARDLAEHGVHQRDGGGGVGRALAGGAEGAERDGAEAGGGRALGPAVSAMPIHAQSGFSA